MTPEQILKIPARVLSQQQREDYFTNGYILLERFIGDEWLKKLRDATNELVEQSKKVTKSDTIFDLEPDLTPSQPRLRRVSNPTDGPGDLLSESSCSTRDHHQTHVSRCGAIYYSAMLNLGDRNYFPILGYVSAKRYVELPLRRR